MASIGSEYVARHQALRRLMIGPTDPSTVLEGIQEIVNERITQLNERLDQLDEQARKVDGGTSGPVN